VVTETTSPESRQAEPPSVASRATGWSPDRSWLLTLAAAIIAGIVFLGARNTLVDDAYITLDYARNLAFHLHWGLTTAATANTATSPLNVLVLGLVTAVTRRPVLALGVVYVLSAVALEFGLRRTARAVGLPAWLGLLAVALVSVNPLLISAIGLETAMGAGLIALLLAAAMTGKPWRFGVLAGLLVLTRPDLIIVVLVVFLFVRPGWRQGWWRASWRGVVGALAVVLPWHLWSWLVLGSALPDTLIIKSAEHAWGPENFGNGPYLYLYAYPAQAALSFAPAALGALAALGWLCLRVIRPTARVRRLDRLIALPLAGGLHYLAYTAIGVPPYHWYYGPSLFCLIAYLASAIAALWPPAGVGVPARLPAYAGLAVVAALLVVSVGDYTGGGLPRRAAQITTNWAVPREYALVGTQLRRLVGNRSVQSAGEIGALAYFCNCAILDVFSDPGAANTLINTGINRHNGLTRTLLDVNFRFRDRSVRPIVPDLLLDFGAAAPAGALAAWPVDSPWTGRNVLSLVRNPAKR
jgi:hypothetical protein